MSSDTAPTLPPTVRGYDPAATRDDRPPRAATEPGPLPERIGPYDVESRLGRGGMGEVFLAHDARLDRTVAIKRILPRDGVPLAREERARLRREARVLARLNHAAVVQIYDVLEEEDGDSLVMEHVEGCDLKRLMDHRPLSWRRAAALGEQIARGLEAAHRKDIIHRDLKAENILVTPEDEVKITDFGIAKERIDTDSNPTQISDHGIVIGTFRAMSPEQAQGLRVDARSDLFALGSLLYEMVTGYSPFEGSGLWQTLYNVIYTPHTPLLDRVPDLPKVFANLVDHLLDKDPDQRPTRAAEVAMALARLASPAREASGDIETSSGSGPTAPARGLSERREVTAICCDLAMTRGSEEITLDPELLLEVLPALRDLAREVVRHHGGELASALSHRLVICFGYPRAHGDDPRRAAHAALDLLDRSSEIARRFPEASGLSLRLGLHTGPAVVSASQAPDEQLILGPTLDVANGLQSLAPPGQALLSAATARRLGALFTFEELPPVHLRGTRRPIAVCRLRGERATERPVSAAAASFVARHNELEMLLDRWNAARSGHGQVVLARGEAGIGKSRLVAALRDSIDAPIWWSVRASPDTASSPFHPMAELLHDLLDLPPDTPREEQLERLDEVAAHHGLASATVVPHLASLLGLQSPEVDSSRADSERRRREVIDSLVALILVTSEERPVALVVEDLHWLDPSTLELLKMLTDRLWASAVFVLLTCRPHGEPRWSARDYLTRIELEPLNLEETEKLVHRVAAARGKHLGKAQIRELAERADGIPLFAEELTKSTVETGASVQLAAASSPAVPPSIPATLYGSLLARLDRLGEAKEIAQLAAVIGRQVPETLLQLVLDATEPEPAETPDSGPDEHKMKSSIVALRNNLARLTEAEILRREEGASGRRWVFRHTLLRDAAYASLLARDRRRLHHQLAEALASGAIGIGIAEPQQLAHHWAAAGEVERAVRAWLEAGRVALEGSAREEGLDALYRGLALMNRLPSGEARDALERRYRKLLAAERGPDTD